VFSALTTQSGDVPVAPSTSYPSASQYLPELEVIVLPPIPKLVICSTYDSRRRENEHHKHHGCREAPFLKHHSFAPITSSLREGYSAAFVLGCGLGTTLRSHGNYIWHHCECDNAGELPLVWHRSTGTMHTPNRGFSSPIHPEFSQPAPSCGRIQFFVAAHTHDTMVLINLLSLSGYRVA
jgi:hypothetical protein